MSSIINIDRMKKSYLFILMLLLSISLVSATSYYIYPAPVNDSNTIANGLI
jgi:hypothetical protein